MKTSFDTSVTRVTNGSHMFFEFEEHCPRGSYNFPKFFGDIFEIFFNTTIGVVNVLSSTLNFARFFW